MNRVRSWSKARKIGYGILLVYVLGIVGFAVGFGIKGHKNESFKVIDAFHLETWFHIAGPLNFDKGVLYLLLATLLTHRHHGVRRAPHAEAPGPAADRGRDGLQPDVAGHAREHGREDDQEMVPARLHAVRVHPRLQPDRLHPAAGRLAEHVQAVRRAHPVLPDLRGGDERRGPAGARPRRVLSPTTPKASARMGRSDTSRA